MKKKIILAIILVIILLGAGISYAYFATDLFKTDKEIFLSYILDSKMLEQFGDKAITDYVEKQNSTAYTNKGEITLNASGLGEEVESVLNKTKVTIEGKNDNVQNKVEQNITLDFSQGFNIPISFRNNGDIYGIQSDFLSEKYIAVRNENLHALFQKFDIDTEGMPDKIDFSQQPFTVEEQQKLEEKYGILLANNLEDELFTKSKVENQTVVTLNMSEAKFIDVFVKVLTELRNDDLFLNKLGDSQKATVQEEIDKLITDLSDIKTSETNRFEIKIYIKSKKVQKIEFNVLENSASIGSIIVESADNELLLKVYDTNKQIGSMRITKEVSGIDISYNISINLNSDGDELQLDCTLLYKNILALNNVEEICDIKLSTKSSDIEKDEEDEEDVDSSIFVPTIPTNGENMEINVKYSNLKTFTSELQIEELNSSNAIILNDATEEELQGLLLGIYQKFGLI